MCDHRLIIAGLGPGDDLAACSCVQPGCVLGIYVTSGSVAQMDEHSLTALLHQKRPNYRMGSEVYKLRETAGSLWQRHWILNWRPERDPNAPLPPEVYILKDDCDYLFTTSW